MDELKAQQREELKELQAKIQSLKHSVPKGDKKKKKLVMGEIALLEEQVKEKHAEEMLMLENQKAISPEQKNLDEDLGGERGETIPKLSRAQKRRNKKEAATKERQKYIEEAEKDSVNSARNLELRALQKDLDSFDLEIVEVSPDGNCLFAAIGFQLAQECGANPVEYLRKVAADYMRTHKDDFLPFLVNPETGNMYDEDGFSKYCLEMETTHAWGGQVEIKALSYALTYPVEVYQANTPVLKIGEEFDRAPVRLSYHRHAFELGEHYNAVRKRTDVCTTE